MAESSLKGVMIGAGFFTKVQANAWKQIDNVDLVVDNPKLLIP